MINFLVKRFYHMIQNVGSISSNSIGLIRFVFLENAKFFERVVTKSERK